MTPVPSVIDRITANRWFRNDWRRRGVAAVMVVVLLLASYFPREYRTATAVATTDAASLGLGAALGQTNAYNSVFAGQAALEIALRVGRSQETRRIVIDKLDLVKARNFSSYLEADRWLASHVDINAIRGGMLEIQMVNREPKFSLKVVTEMVRAIRFRLGEISRNQTSYKRRTLQLLLNQANLRLDTARAKYNAYRLKTGYTTPAAALGAIGARVPYFRNAIKAKEMELEKARTFATDNNMSVRQINTEISVLKSQLADALKLDATQPYSVDRVVQESTVVSEFETELFIAQQQRDSYKFYLEGTTVEDLTSVANMRVLEPPYVDTGRPYKTFPLLLAFLVILFELIIEVYYLRPPLSEVRRRSNEV